jgi:hypothetical protein
VHFVAFAAKTIDPGRDQIDDRPRASGAVFLGDAIELDG